MAPLSGSVLLDWVALAVGLLTVIYFVLSRNFNHWKNKGVEYLKPNLFLGNCKKLFFLEMSPGMFMDYIYKQGQGPLLGFFIFGRPALMVRDTSIMKNILIKDFNYFSERHTHADEKNDPVGASSLFVFKGAKWRHMRAKLTPTFTSGKMKQMFEHIAVCAEELQDHITNSNKRIDDIKDVMANFTTDVISSCAFGITSNSFKDPNAVFRKFGRAIFETSKYRAYELVSIFFVPSIVRFAKFQFLSKGTTDFLRKVFWDTLVYREENNIKRNDMIDLLIHLKNKYSINGTEFKSKLKDDNNVAEMVYTEDELMGQAAQFFAAGFETTASTMSFALYELAMNPDAQAKLRKEMSDSLKENNGKITYEMIHGMKYLDMVVSETMRKYPPLAFMDRIAAHDYKINGTDITIEKDTPVFMSILGLQTDPQYFKDPLRFDPERFNETNKGNIVPMSYVPFGEGPHNCIGQRFGLMTSKAGLVYILSKYEVKPCKDTPTILEMEPKTILTASIGGIPLFMNKSELY